MRIENKEDVAVLREFYEGLKIKFERDYLTQDVYYHHLGSEFKKLDILIKQTEALPFWDLSSEIDFLLRRLSECEGLLYSSIENSRQKYISMAIFLPI